ncbi:pyruvate/2-oxoglutarate dehydrogenase complex dihydrolipoamide dehydrogenase (E3) component [Acidipila rosea]|uniref:Pyruvate/2-oxoglutarate dehydrogenase complex dihydrolipoamide dehydrogenase (E3) component n=1 Tax=Acidipila rosea TaxID=768535 RepID=A0A4R1LDY6_9BACT|nr:pyruvate/2-oxoglutarate dehydrogenase complex dihydrolipoamide dehydrogenase (E3) component [Acidipila rosea]
MSVKATDHFDAIILGSGQAGNPLASALAKSGRRTAIIESKHLGGTCINEGCTPTKTMVASARAAWLARRGADYGFSACEAAVNMEQVRARKRQIVDSSREHHEKAFSSMENLTVLMGLGSFAAPRQLRVELNDGSQQVISAEHVFINTGCRSAIPPLNGLDETPFLDNNSIMELDRLPEHLIILGGGYIAVEFGQMFRRFGSRVTIVQSGRQLLEREDPDIAEEVQQILTQDGIEILLSSMASRVRPTSGGLTADVKTPSGPRTIQGSHLLVATGRVPNTDRLNLTAAGVATDSRGYIEVNDRLETSAPGVYALGDVKGGPAFTHISYDDYRIVKANLLDGGSRTTTGRMVPYTVYMDPQLGRIGLTEAEAREAGNSFRIAKMPMTSVARAREIAEIRGVMKILVDSTTEKILGAAMLGSEGGEMAAMVQIAMMGGLGFTALRDAIFAHPTWAESLNNIFFAWADESA